MSADAPEPVFGTPAPDADGRFTSRSGTFIGGVNVVAQVADRLLSFLQIVVIAALLGATSSADLYFLAGIVPLMLGVIVGEPIGRAALSLLVRAPTRERADALVGAGFAVVVAAFLLATAVYDVAVVLVVREVTPTGSGAVLPWLAFSAAGPALGVGAYLGGVVLWLERYAVAALRIPLASLVGLLLLIAVAATTKDVAWVAAAVAGGYVVATLWLLVEVTRSLGARWPLAGDRAAVAEAAGAWRRIAAPVAGGAMGGQVIVMIERLLASRLGPGAVAIVSYARGIAGAPNALAAAVGAGAYPGLVRAEAAGAREYVRSSFLLGFRVSLYSGIVFASVFALFGQDIVAFLLQRGAFELGDVERAGSVLVAFALSTLTGALIMYLLAVLYGIDRFGAILLFEGTIFVSYVVLAPVLRSSMELDGLALAFGLAQLGGVAYATVHVARRVGAGAGMLVHEWLLPVLLRAAPVVGLLALFRVLVDEVALPVDWRGIVRVGGAAVLVVTAGTVALAVGSVPEARRFRDALRRRARAG